MRFFPFCILLLASTSSRACYWDSDTLRNEATKFPDLIDVATGRFERFPTLYYQMRLDRVAAELKVHPEKLSDYDDAGVACERLGNDDAALEWMAKKRHELKVLGGRDDDATYKLLSNEGTFYLLKWLKSGRDPDDLSLLDKSLEDLRAGVKLNPSAHFGREVIQIGFVEWIELVSTYPEIDFDLPSDDPKQPVGLHKFLNKRKGFSDAAIQKGLSGLVVLGAAWESPDVFVAIKDTLPEKLGVLGRFLDDRADELVAGGIPKLGNHDPGLRYGASEEVRPSIDASFHLLRKAADDENSRREVYILDRMDQGRHPDTDPTFWNEWKSKKRPEFVDPPFFVRWENELRAAVLGLIVILAIAGLRWRDVRRRRQKLT